MIGNLVGPGGSLLGLDLLKSLKRNREKIIREMITEKGGNWSSIGCFNNLFVCTGLLDVAR